MPKGTIRNPGSKKPMVSSKTWSGKKLPLRSKAELTARNKNIMHEGMIYTSDKYERERETARGARAEPGKGPVSRARENPMTALKRRAAQKKKK